MANEVIIVEMRKPDAKEGQMNIFGDIITTQIIDIGSLSAELDGDTAMVQIISKGVGFWYATGNSAASAAANTAGSVWLKANDSHSVSTEGDRYIDTAADA